MAPLSVNRRIQKTVNKEVFNYIYDGLNIVAILDENQDLLATILHDENIDAPLSITTYDTSHLCCDKYKALSEEDKFLIDKKRTNTYYYHRDHQNSIIALSNKDGKIIESIIYDNTYGSILKHNKSIETYNPYFYTGREFDCDDLYYYRARYYDSTTQRFLSLDPIEFMSGDFNFYRYVWNEPVNFTDPLGFAKCDKKSQNARKDKFRQNKDKLFKGIRKTGNAVLKSAAKKGAAALAVIVDGPLPIGDAIAVGLMIWDGVSTYNLGSEIIDAVSDADSVLDELIECNEKAQKDKQDGNKIKGDANEKKCKELNGKNATGKYKGGSYKGTKESGIESHHMPAKSSYPGWNNRTKTGIYNGGKVSEGNMPAIQMDPGDHQKTLSHGWEGNVGKSYRSMQNKLIRAGMLKEAMLMDIADIKTQFGNKYDKAIAEMMVYSKCMGFI